MFPQFHQFHQFHQWQFLSLEMMIPSDCVYSMAKPWATVALTLGTNRLVRWISKPWLWRVHIPLGNFHVRINSWSYRDTCFAASKANFYTCRILSLALSCRFGLAQVGNVCVYIYIHTHTYIHMHIYIIIYIYIYTYIHIHIYRHIYIYTYT